MTNPTQPAEPPAATTAAVDTDVVEFSRLGAHISLNWSVVLRTWETFVAAMRAAPGCNNFDPRAVADTFKPLYDEAMSVEYGYEDSAVLYVAVPYFPHQRISTPTAPWTGERISDSDRHDYTERVITWARGMRADAITVRQYPQPANGRTVVGKPGPHPHRIRLWWDWNHSAGRTPPVADLSARTRTQSEGTRRAGLEPDHPHRPVFPAESAMRAAAAALVRAARMPPRNAFVAVGPLQPLPARPPGARPAAPIVEPARC